MEHIWSFEWTEKVSSSLTRTSLDQFLQAADEVKRNFDNQVNALASWSDADDLKLLMKRAIQEMHTEIQERIYTTTQYSKERELWNFVDSKIKTLWSIATLNKQWLDNLIDTWMLDFSWDYDLDNSDHRQLAVNEILWISPAQSLASESNPSLWNPLTAYANGSITQRRLAENWL